MYWVSQNPPPAHLFLISTDGDFANILHRLRLSNYNILLSSSENAPVVLRSAASIMWLWKSLLKGEDLDGKHFNQPPDGPYGSWYGHYKLPLDNPVAVTAQPVARADGSSDAEPKLRPVPKTVVKQIRDVVNLYPKGISIRDLYSELGKNNVPLDKDWYGYKEFSCFILSNSHILKIQSWGESQLSVRSIAPTGEGILGIHAETVTNDKDLKKNIPEIINYSESSSSRVEDKTSFPISSNANVKEPIRNVKESPKQVRESVKQVLVTSPLVEKVNGTEIIKENLMKSEELKNVEEPQEVVPNPPLVAENEKCAEVSMSNLEGQNPDSKIGFLRTIWRKWLHGENTASANKNVEPEDLTTLNEDNKRIEDMKKECVESTCQCIDAIQRSPKVSATEQTIIDENGATSCETTRGPGILNKMIRWWRGPESDNSIKLSSDNVTTTKVDDNEQGVFTNSFWDDMVAFLQTSSGSNLVMRSKSRYVLS